VLAQFPYGKAADVHGWGWPFGYALDFGLLF